METGGYECMIFFCRDGFVAGCMYWSWASSFSFCLFPMLCITGVPAFEKDFVIWYYMDATGVSCLEVDTGRGYTCGWITLFFWLEIHNITIH